MFVKISVLQIQRMGVAMAVAAALIACNNGGTDKSGGMGVDELIAVMDDKGGDTVTVSGFCIDVCGHGSSHITLAGEDTTRVIQAVADRDLRSFDNAIRYRNVTVRGVLMEQRVDSAFLLDWETRLDESLKGPNGNPKAVAQLKMQIAELRDSIAVRYRRQGRNYWSQFHIAASSYECE